MYGEVIRLGGSHQQTIGVFRAREIVLSEPQAQRISFHRQRIGQLPAVGGLLLLLTFGKEEFGVLICHLPIMPVA